MTVLMCSSLLAACAGLSAEPLPPREVLSSADITQTADEYKALAETCRVAHNEKDHFAIEALFTQDMVFDDYTFGDHLVGIRDFMKMTDFLFRYFPDFQWGEQTFFINQDKIITIAEFWNVKFTIVQYTEDDHFVHVFLSEPLGEQLSSFRLFYGDDFLVENWLLSEDESTEMVSTLLAYATAWSSMDADVVAELYAKDALRQDTLFGEHQDGRRAIKDFATSFFNWYPDVQWTALEMFGEKAYRDSPQGIGSAYTIAVTDPAGETCEVKLVVLLHVLDGQIVQEDLFYDADSLIQCGWAQ